MKLNKTLAIISLLLVHEASFAKSAPWVGMDFNNHPCQGSGQGFGPYDYTNSSHKSEKIGGGNDTALTIVDRNHFSPETEAFFKPMTGSFSHDIDYTLRAWPNHHRALLTITRYQIMINKGALHGEALKSPVECYFQRAINFSPNDSGAHSLYANYLSKMGKTEKAKEWYEKALEISPNSSKIAYAYSLFLIDQKQYDTALEYAHKAYQNGKPPAGLKNKLKQLGAWKDPQ